MSARGQFPETTEKIDELIRRSNSDRSVSVLVGLRDDLQEPEREILEQAIEDLDAELIRDVGFGIYKLQMPVSTLSAITNLRCLEYVEYANPNGSPKLLGN